MFMVKDEIVKWLINEGFIQKTGDIKHLSYQQLVAKYQVCVKQYQASKEYLESLAGFSIM